MASLLDLLHFEISNEYCGRMAAFQVLKFLLETDIGVIWMSY